MKRETVGILACPACRGSNSLDVFHEQDGEVERGRLICDACGVAIPVLHGFPLFTEARLNEGLASEADLEALSTRLFGDLAAYDAYRRQKDERGLWESYAAFQPFNESSRAAAPLLPAIQAHLKPGDIILDTWGRTGWSGEWLAGLFPDCRVISLWEGDSSVLGYRGFRYWLNAGRRAPNLDILFTPPNRPLPFASETFGAVYALDCLHRYELSFGSECLRVARPDAALLFAHLHLTNAEPDPWFERGCRQVHGRDYRVWLDTALKNDSRRSWVLAETDLFNARPGDILADTPETPHYNGDIFIAQADRSPMIVKSMPKSPPGSYFLVTPLLRLDFGRNAVMVDGALHDSDIGRLLDRHPVYRQRLPNGLRSMSNSDWLGVCLAVTGRTAGEIRASMGEASSLDDLIDDEILLPVQISAKALELQRFHGNQLPLFQGAALWDDLMSRLRNAEAPAIVLPDGSEVSGQDVARTVSALSEVMSAAIADFDQTRINLEASDEPLGLLVLLGAVSAGIDVVLGDTAADGLLVHKGAGGQKNDAVQLYGSADCLAARLAEKLESGNLTMCSSPGGLITLRGCSPLPAFLFIEAAASLRHALRPDLSGISDFCEMNELLHCLAGLFRSEPLIFAGADR